MFGNLHSEFGAFDPEVDPLFDQAGESLVGCDLFANVSGLLGGLLGTVPNGGPLNHISVFLPICEGFVCRLTKLLLKAVLVLFCGKSSMFQFIRALLSMRVILAHKSLNGLPFVAVPGYLDDNYENTVSDAKKFDILYICPNK